MRLPFWSWESTFRKLGFKRVVKQRTFRPRVETLEPRVVLTLNTPPIAVGNLVEAVEDQAYVAGPGFLLANDTDADDDALAAVLVSGPAHGTLAFNANSSFRYVPAAGYSGPDSFVYRARDPFSQSEPATVTINVAPVNDPPTAADNLFSLLEDGVLESLESVLANDTDPEQDSLVAELLTDPVNGTLTLAPTGLFTYTPAPDFAGEDWFTYRAVDSAGAASLPATVTLTVNPVNDAPIAASDVGYETTEETPLTIEAEGVLFNDFDVDFDPLSATVIQDVSHGTLELASDGGFVYTPDADFSGLDTFTYAASDGAGGTSTAVVTITVHDLPENEAPIAVDDDGSVGYAVDEDTVLTVSAELGVLTNDTDPNGDPLTATLVSQAAHGIVALNLDGSFT